MSGVRWTSALVAALAFPAALGAQDVAVDDSPHAERRVRVDPSVTLEVLDWGGTGQPIVLLAGRGNTAHVFDDFAPKLVGDYRVYGITRRGFGNSTYTTEGFLADDLGDDVLDVLDSLGIQRPVVIGHSIAGQELSSIGSRSPERIAGLVYLDAGFHFAFYDSSLGRAPSFFRDTRRKLARLSDLSVGMTLGERGALIQELLDRIPILERDLLSYREQVASVTDQSRVLPRQDSDAVRRALAEGQQVYTSIEAPVLAVFAHPPEYPSAVSDSASRARYDSIADVRLLPRIEAFQRGVPSARVLRIPHANHYVFRSHEDEVLQGIRTFIDELRSVVASADASAACGDERESLVYIVNGTPATCGSVMAIPRVRIASIDVFKGAAAAERYPGVSDSGVIVIQTKPAS